MTRCVWANKNPETQARHAWDMAIVESLTRGFDHTEDMTSTEEGAVVVIAGQHNRWTKYAEPLATFVADLPWALVVITSDEEALFPVECLPADMQFAVWGQYHDRTEFDRIIPIGRPPDTTFRSVAVAAVPDATEHRDLDVFFAGQNTHARREELIDTMKAMATEPGHGNISWVASTGFRAGLERDDYLACMARTKIAPCPSGYHSLDSFRLYEAIAAGALPIIETHTPDGEEGDFWTAMFGGGFGFSLPIVDSWDMLTLVAKAYKDEQMWRIARDRCAAWFADYRKQLASDFAATIARLQS